MRFLFVILAILCGIALVIRFGTGDLSAEQVAGIGIILVGLAVVAPPNWPAV